MTVDYPLAQEHFVPRNFMFDSNARKAIVIHKTGGDATPQAVYNTFLASGNPGKSVHYAVGTDGTIWQFVPEALGAGGNCCLEPGHDPFWTPYANTYGNLNLCTISIEHCDAALDNSTEVTSAQRDASFKLVAYLAKKYGIDAAHIKTHASLDPQSRARCPGNYPMQELLAYVEQGGSTTMPIPAGWHDDGATLTAPNGHSLVLGFRQHVLDAPIWDSGNEPNEEEYHADQVLLHNAEVGDGQRVTLRDCLLWWTAKEGVVQEPYPGLELKACYDLISAQQAEIATLKAQPPQQQPTPNVSDAVLRLQALGVTVATSLAMALKDLGA